MSTRYILQMSALDGYRLQLYDLRDNVIVAHYTTSAEALKAQEELNAQHRNKTHDRV